jgi:hypothetical protein
MLTRGVSIVFYLYETCLFLSRLTNAVVVLLNVRGPCARRVSWGPVRYIPNDDNYNLFVLIVEWEFFDSHTLRRGRNNKTTTSRYRTNQWIWERPQQHEYFISVVIAMGADYCGLRSLSAPPHSQSGGNQFLSHLRFLDSRTIKGERIIRASSTPLTPKDGLLASSFDPPS